VNDPDPYEILGLEPGAGEAAIGAAYRRQARRHHPQGYPDDTPAERSRRHARMAEINAAHDLLRAGWKPSPEPAAPRRTPVPPRSQPPPVSPYKGPEPPQGQPVSPWKVLLVLGAALTGLIAAVTLAFAIFATETPPAPSTDFPLVVDVESWTVGTCISDGAEAGPVRCEFPNRGVVVADVFNTAQCPATTEAVVADPPRVLCIDLVEGPD
jgi:hypothetical protein